jgi:uncharacterized protein
MAALTRRLGLVALAAVAFAGTAAIGLARADAATPIPAAPSAFVTDRAGFLSPAAVSELSQKLEAYERGTGHQLIVWIDRTTGGVPIEDWAVKAFKAWGVGRKGHDDGVALFIFSDDRTLRIEVGYGLEGNVPDARAGRIVQHDIAPRIRAGDRDGAVRAGVDALIAAIGGAPEPKGRGQAANLRMLMLFLLPLIPVLFTLLAWRAQRSRGYTFIGSGGTWGSGWGGGGWGGGGGGWGGGGGFSGGGGSSGGGGASGGW